MGYSIPVVVGIPNYIEDHIKHHMACEASIIRSKYKECLQRPLPSAICVWRHLFTL